MDKLTITRDGKILLELPGKCYKSRRWVGTLKGGTLYVQRDPHKHFFKASQSFGFNYEMVKRANYKTLCVELPFGQRLLTTRDYLVAHGEFLNFQRNRLEKQIFLKVSEFGMEKASQWEAEQANQAKEILQGTLFGEAA